MLDPEATPNTRETAEATVEAQPTRADSARQEAGVGTTDAGEQRAPTEPECDHSHAAGFASTTSGQATTPGADPEASVSTHSSHSASSLSPTSTSAVLTTVSDSSYCPPPLVPTPPAPERATVSHAVVVSVDGLAARYLEAVIASGAAPTFQTLQGLAAWTHDARADKTYTITLPNHTSMLTGLPVSPSQGFESFQAHRHTNNTDPAIGETLHALRLPARDYTPGVFDVAHDHGHSTALFASKSKFSLFANTWVAAGGLDLVGDDNGRQKIDTFVYDPSPATLVDKVIEALTINPPNFTFVHLNEPDLTGHATGWGSDAYLAAIAQMDAQLGRLLATIRSGDLAGNTTLIVTTDHGGVGSSHLDAADILNFQIPFYVMAPGVPSGDAYAAFGNRFRPGTVNPEYVDVHQPLRNGDAGNLALFLLGLPPVPESVIHSADIHANP